MSDGAYRQANVGYRPSGSLTPSRAEVIAATGYPRADSFAVNAALPAPDWSLQPFDKMGQATVGLIATGWTTVVGYTMANGWYGLNEWIGQDCNDPTAYQRVSWRVMLNGVARGGDENNLLPYLEARCGILDGTMCPWPLFIPMGARIELQALLANPAALEESVVVRARVKGVMRDNQSGGVRV